MDYDKNYLGENMLRVLTTVIVCLNLMTMMSVDASADNWMNWRGPYGTGRVKAGDYPVNWSSEQNVSWKVELPSRAGSTPVIVGNKLILTATIDRANGVLCYNLAGEELWRKTIGEAREGKHKKASASNPSPVTDGKHLFVYFKSGDLAGLDLDGNVVWQKNLQTAYGEDTLWWDLGTSPVLTNKHVVIACMQSPPSPSYVAAFDKQTGEVAWKVDRELGAPEEAAQSYSTPSVVEFEGETRILIVGADYATCHSAENGQEIWRVGTLNPDQERYFRSIASGVVTAGIYVAPYARGNTLTAIRMGGKGDVTKSHVLWTKNGLSSDVPTPAAIDGKVYVCTDKGTVACVEAESGRELWQTETPKHRLKFSASPVIAGDYLYVTREDTTTFVVNIKTRKIVSENALNTDDFIVSTPAFANGNIFIRSFTHLYCIGSTATKVSQR